jgi:methionyl-tRNA formyltransferase
VRIVFVGTPESAAASLRTLVRERFNITGVLTRPDSPKGRSLQLSTSPVKEAALEAKLPVYQFGKVSSPEGIDKVRSLEPDVIVVVAFGEILSEEFLRIPAKASVNVHFSLLPKYRGAGPVQWAIIHGEEGTGVTIQHMVKKLDAGDIILQEKVPISAEETAGSLSKTLAELGGEVLVKALRRLEAGTASRTPQDESRATYARKLTKKDGEVDWHLSGKSIVDRIRGMNPWPGAYTYVPGKGGPKCLKLLRAGLVAEASGEAGRVLAAKETFVVAARKAAVELLLVQPEGKKPMEAAAFLRGHPLEEGILLGERGTCNEEETNDSI